MHVDQQSLTAMLSSSSINSLVEEVNVFNTDLSYLFYAIFIGLRLKNPVLSLGSLGNKFYPINVIYIINYRNFACVI